ncbi:hypothetical protein Fmac_011849 [Flemingia macrophylla]|uniref:Uncharacterized protein n=1 Tax=Flemingia macrophylla TaxID=520843 RepID=A0ABD1MNL2_9FABA
MKTTNGEDEPYNQPTFAVDNGKDDYTQEWNFFPAAPSGPPPPQPASRRGLPPRLGFMAMCTSKFDLRGLFLGQDWQIGRGISEGGVSQEISHCWKPSDEGGLKCNIDAVIFMAMGKFGVGLCIRDHNDTLFEQKLHFFICSNVTRGRSNDFGGTLEMNV